MAKEPWRPRERRETGRRRSRERRVGPAAGTAGGPAAQREGPAAAAGREAPSPPPRRLKRPGAAKAARRPRETQGAGRRPDTGDPAAQGEGTGDGDGAGGTHGPRRTPEPGRDAGFGPGDRLKRKTARRRPQAGRPRKRGRGRRDPDGAGGRPAARAAPTDDDTKSSHWNQRGAHRRRPFRRPPVKPSVATSFRARKGCADKFSAGTGQWKASNRQEPKAETY